MAIHSTEGKNLGRHDFLRLMITQMQHPSQSIHKESFQQRATSLLSNQALQASALVGRNVLVESDLFSLGATCAVELPFEPSELHVLISTESDILVKEMMLPCNDQGFFQFNWDGMDELNHHMPEGTYKMALYILDDDKKVFLNPLVSANVDSVSLWGNDLRLNTAELGSISLDRVKQIFVASPKEGNHFE